MRLSSKVEYGTKALLDLAINRQLGLVPLSGIAERINAPLKFLEQILLTLKAAGIVDSKRGIGGGFYLVRPPQAITIGEVVNVLDGPVGPMSCVNDLSGRCQEQATCSIRHVWVQAHDAMERVLADTSFADLVLHHEKQTAAHCGRTMYYI